MNSIPTTTLCMYLFGCDLSPDPLCRRAIYCSYEKSALQCAALLTHLACSTLFDALYFLAAWVLVKILAIVNSNHR